VCSGGLSQIASCPNVSIFAQPTRDSRCEGECFGFCWGYYRYNYNYFNPLCADICCTR